MYVQRSFVKKQTDDRKWYVVDATDKVVGRLATEIASVLKGKNSPQYTPNIDSGDFVVVVNAEKVKFTGNKWNDKVYFWHTNHIGGLKRRTAKEQLTKHPELILMDAVKGMLPKTSLGRSQLKKLKVYKGPHHPHDAQEPQQLKL